MKFKIFFIFVTLTYFIEKGSSNSVEYDSLNNISSSVECNSDVKKLCKDIKGDISILSCLQSKESTMRQISVGCQHFLWTFKHKLTISNYFDGVATNYCKDDLNNIEECTELNIGYKIPCLLDHDEKIKSNNCKSFLFEIGVIVFSDFNLISKFIDKCNDDVQKYQCGRISRSGSNSDGSDEKPLKETKEEFVDYITSQSHTVECLIDSIESISKDCQHQIFRLTELQSNDYHLNRGLFLACVDDREILCPNVKSGEGRVYSCLIHEKFNKKMSKRCQKELTRKQIVESLDVAADYPLFQNCKKDIVENDCPDSTRERNHKIVLMSIVLLCLNEAQIRGKKLDPKCSREIEEKRMQLLDDHKISPEILVSCKTDLQSNCKFNENEPGKVVHCLMEMATPDFREKDAKQLSAPCKTAMMTLVKAANPTKNIMSTDRVIREACIMSFMSICGEFSTDQEAFRCLTQNLEHDKMEPQCRDKLKSILYFTSLDLTINNDLNLQCHKDAVRLCNGPDTFEATRRRTLTEAQLEYFCMYEHYKNDRLQMEVAEVRGLDKSKANLTLSEDCYHGIYAIIAVQASKIEIQPTVFKACFNDLIKFCTNMDAKGREIDCLQMNLKKLEKECNKQVVLFSTLEDMDTRLNRKISTACSQMYIIFCPGVKSDQSFTCLAEHKNNPHMSEPCKIAIEHFQIISLQDYRIDHRFAAFCSSEIDQFCQKELTGGSLDQKDGDRNNKEATKSAIVSCLSLVVTKKLIEGELHPLSQECRRQFSYELLQRSESINLDPLLLADCSVEIKKFCTKVKSGHINSCLRQHQDQLDSSCHKRLFKRERLESLDADFDGELQHRCSDMIAKYCHDTSGRRLFRCLHGFFNEEGFSKKCKDVIMVRLERRMNDVRLNPGLLKHCSDDIIKYCKINNPKLDEPTSGLEYHGQVIHCLKKKYIENKKSMKPNCQNRIREIIIEANIYTRLDPTLRRKCAMDISEQCKDVMTDEKENNIAGVYNCLKRMFLADKLREKSCRQEVLRLLEEGKADVHVDSELYTACEDAIIRLCRYERLGDGRKMGCLLAIASNDKSSVLLNPECLRTLKERQSMWLKAGTLESQSLKDLFSHVANSAMSAYLMTMLGLMVVGFILLGICFGRVTKRVRVDLKNK